MTLLDAFTIGMSAGIGFAIGIAIAAVVGGAIVFCVGWLTIQWGK